MRPVSGGRAATRTLRELGEALADGPFRVALVLSLLVHLALLLLARGDATSEERRPLMRVRIVRQEAGASAATPSGAPPPGPAAASVTAKPAPKPASREQPSQPAPAPAGAEIAASPLPPEPEVPLSAPPVPAAAAPPAQPAVEASPEAVPETAVEVVADVETTVPALAPGPGPGAAASEAAAGQATEGGMSAAAPPAAAVASGAAEAADGGASVAIAAAAGASGAAPPDLSALRRRIEARKVYPQIAVRNGWEGRVLVEMRLEMDGRLAAVRLVEGSGYSILDQATIAAVRLASPFPPVARVVQVPVEYRLLP